MHIAYIDIQLTAACLGLTALSKEKIAYDEKSKYFILINQHYCKSPFRYCAILYSLKIKCHRMLGLNLCTNYQETELLCALNEREIEATEADPGTLFRATTLASTLMEQYMRSTCASFVNLALKDVVKQITEEKQSCEVNIVYNTDII